MTFTSSRPRTASETWPVAFLDRENRIRYESTTGTVIATALRDRGYFVFKSVLASRRDFVNCYLLFDELCNAVSHDRSIADRLYAAVQEWQAEGDIARYFCGVPAGFKTRNDRDGSSGHRFKDYLQYTLAFAQSNAFRRSGLQSFPCVAQLYESLAELHFTCSGLFTQAIKSICNLANQSLYSRLVYDDRLAPVVIKVLRYRRNPLRWATDPHFDKSALSLIIHSDDEEFSVRLGAQGSGAIRLSELRSPISYPKSPVDPNDAVLITGLCLREMGLGEFPPSPHLVLPVTDRPFRHSIVAFYLVPYLRGTDILRTTVNFINDVDGRIT